MSLFRGSDPKTPPWGRTRLPLPLCLSPVPEPGCPRAARFPPTPITQSQVFIKHLLCARCCSRAGMLAWAAVHGKDLALALRDGEPWGGGA